LREALGIEPLDWQKRHVAVALGAAHFGHSLWAIPSAVVPWWIDFRA
jgi:hypothetical protein